MKRLNGFVLGLACAAALIVAVGAGSFTGAWFYGDDSNAALDLGSGAVVRFSSTTSGDPGAGAAFDVGLKRSAIGVLAATNGSSGSGGLAAATIGPDATHQDTLPSVNADTFTLNGATQVLTAKTLTTPTINGTSITLASGVVRPVRFNSLSTRYELKWVAGQRGTPGINADIQNATESVRMIVDPDFEILGTNGTSALCSFYAEGGIKLTTAGADNDQEIVLPHLDTNQSAWTQVKWGTDDQTEWECDISTDSNITSIIVWAGLKLTNTSTTATDDDQVFFRFTPATNSGKWQAIYSIGGTDTAGDSGVTVVASTRYHLKISIDSSRIATMYLNGALVATSTALTNATDLIPYIGVQASGAAAAKVLRVHGQSISRVIG